MLLNLVTNASDSIGEDGEIQIRVGETLLEDAGSDPSLFGQRTTGGNFVYFEVADTGQGISPAIIQRMFEPFFTTKSGGRGLGLSMVYGYVNKHDGLIRCSSSEGKGTAIQILLPKCAAERLAGVKDEDSDKFFTQDAKSGECTLQNIPSAPIVVVDDDHQVLDVIQRLLVRQQYPCELLSGGVERDRIPRTSCRSRVMHGLGPGDARLPTAMPYSFGCDPTRPKFPSSS